MQNQSSRSKDHDSCEIITIRIVPDDDPLAGDLPELCEITCSKPRIRTVLCKGNIDEHPLGHATQIMVQVQHSTTSVLEPRMAGPRSCGP